MSVPDFVHVVGDGFEAAYKDLQDYGFDPIIVKSLKGSGKHELTSLQKAIGPNIAKRNDVIVVSDKTDSNESIEKRLLAYMLPVWCSITRKDALFDCRRREHGPRVIVLSASRNSSWTLNKSITFLSDMERSRGVDIMVNYVDNWKLGNRHVFPSWDVLITSIATFGDMIKDLKGRLFQRLDYLVFDECDCYNVNHWETLTMILDIADQHRQINKRDSHVLVISTSKWTDRHKELYEDLMRKRKKIHVYYESILEIYKAVKPVWNVCYINSVKGQTIDQAKILMLSDLFPPTLSSTRRVVIGCGTFETEVIKHYLGSILNLKSEIFHPGATGQIDTIPAGQPKILIVSDKYFDTPQLKDLGPFNWLLSFEGERIKQLCYLRKSWPKMLTPTKESASKTMELKVTFLVTGREPDFLEFYKFCKTLDFPNFPSELEMSGQQLMKQELSGRAFCVSMKLFGYCNYSEATPCNDRHEFNDADVASEPFVSSQGEIEFTVASCQSPSEYTCVLQKQYIKINGEEKLFKSFQNEREEYITCLNKKPISEYSKPVLGDLRYGEMYGFWVRSRNRIIAGKLLPRSIMPVSEPEEITLHNHAYLEAFDTGERLYIKTSELVILPDNLTIPIPCIKVVLSNICPFKNETKYAELEIGSAKQLVKSTKTKTFRGKVWLSMWDTVWINQMISTDKSQKSIKNELLNKVKANPKHLNRLIGLARKLGSAYSEYGLLEEFASAQTATCAEYHNHNDPVQWRHFATTTNLNSVEPTEIRTTYVYDPWLFYGIFKEFEDLLERLRKDLAKWASGDVYDHYNVCEKWFLEQLRKGDVVAVKEDDVESWSWERGVLMDKSGDAKTGFCFEIFLVDDGQTFKNVNQSNIRPISKSLVSRLPFQVVAMSLSHVQPIGGRCCWDSNSEAEVMNLLIPECKCIYIHVLALSAILSEKDGIPCRYYNIVGLYKGNELGNELVKKNVARSRDDITAWVEQMANAFTSLEIDQETDSTTEDSEHSETLSEISLDKFDVFTPSQEVVAKYDVNLNHFNTKPVKSQHLEKGEVHAAIESEGVLDPQAYSQNETTEDNVKKLNSKHTSRKTQASLASTKENKIFPRYPNVTWHQTTTHIYLAVELEDIVDYKFEVAQDKQTINLTINKPVNYGFEITLYGKVLHDEEIILTGQRMKISLKKLNSTANLWTRLVLDNNLNLRWLKANLDFIADDDSDPETENTFRPTQVEFTDYTSGDSDATSDEENEYFKAPMRFDTAIIVNNVENVIPDFLD